MGALYERLAREQQREAAAPSPNAPGHNIGVGEALGEGFIDGASFGFADEIGGGLSGLAAMARGGDFSDTYGNHVRRARARLAAAREQRPLLTGLGSVGGAAAWGLGGLLRGGAAALAPAASRSVAAASGRGLGALRSQLWRASRYGAGAGAAYGVGSAEGQPAAGDGNEAVSDIFDTNRLVGGAAGGAAGAVVAPVAVAATQPIARAIGRGVSGLYNRARSSVTGAPYIHGRAIRDLDAIVGEAGDDATTFARHASNPSGRRVMNIGGSTYQNAYRNVGGRSPQRNAAAARMASSGANRPPLSPDEILDVVTGNAMGVGRAVLRRSASRQSALGPFPNATRNSDLATLLRARSGRPLARETARRLRHYEQARMNRGKWEPEEEGRVTGVTLPIAHGQLFGLDSYDPYDAMTDEELADYYEEMGL